MSELSPCSAIPIDALDGPAGRALVERCRDELATVGACELPGFLEPEAVAHVLEEVAPLRAAAFVLFDADRPGARLSPSPAASFRPLRAT